MTLHRLLQYLNPETAHQLAIWGLKHHPFLRQSPEIEGISRPFLGKTLLNPIGLSAGADKNAAALRGWRRLGLGLVEVGTVTVKARSGNPSPRLWRFPEQYSLVNWLGLPGNGMEHVIANLEIFSRTTERQHLLLGASIASPEGIEDELTVLAEHMAPLCDYIAINVSCPNVEHHHALEQIAMVTKQIQATISGAQGKPVMVKLGPTLQKNALDQISHAAMEAGVTGFIATNTVPYANRDILAHYPELWPMHDAQPVGGYSGPALLAVSTFMIKHLRQTLGETVPLIGVGGIQTAGDAVQMLQAGANAIQLYTGLIYHGAGIVQRMKQALCS